MTRMRGEIRHRAIEADCREIAGERPEFRRDEVERSIVARFKKVVGRNPVRPAVKAKDRELTYRQLDTLSNQLARALIEQRGRAAEPVGLLASQGWQAVVAALGVLKAGKFFVPLDPRYPIDRLNFMLADTEARSIVTDPISFDKAGELARGRLPIIEIDDRLTERPDYLPDVTIGPSALAAVYYTSGSTGRPKGIVYTHRYLLHNFYTFGQALRVTAYDCWSWLHSLSFTLATNDIFCSLTHGASISAWDVARDGLAPLADWLDESAVTILHWTATPFRNFVETLPRSRILDTVRVAAFGGETLFAKDAIAFREFFAPECQFVNRLGASEVGLVRLFFFDRSTAFDEPVVPGGYEVPDKKVVIVDDAGRELPPGRQGEIGVTSPYLPLGYWRQPALTNEKYRTDIDPAGERTYLTGDLGRLRPDGCLEYLGRKDFQVKIRGHRIETGEIEHVLLEIEGVRAAVVIARSRPDQESYLAAYLVAVESPLTSRHAIRAYLATKLPDFMIPSAFVRLDAFPISPNGKLDRPALPAPGSSRPELENPYVAPRNETETQLAGLWCDTLSIEGIGIHDNFFALGGHSLLAARVAARASELFGVELPIRPMFDAPTIAELAAEIDALRARESSKPSRRIETVDRTASERAPLSFGQRRLWFLEQIEGDLAAYNMPYAWEVRGRLDTEALRQAIEAILRRHEPLRTTIQLDRGEPFQRVETVERWDLPIVDLSELQPDEKVAYVDARAIENVDVPFSLDKDLMLRALLLRLADDHHVLLVKIHHIASDGWSMRLFRRELGSLYHAFSRGEPPRVPSLPITYADFAAWQRERLDGERLAELLGFWRKAMDGLPPLTLPTDRPRPASPTHRGGCQLFSLAPDVVGPLRALARAQGATLHMVLLAAFQTLVSRHTGQEDLAIGTPAAGRSQTALEDMIGFFVNTLVVRTDLSGDPTFRELIDRVRAASLAAYEHQDLPFEKLVEELRPDRQAGYGPFVPVMFQLINFADGVPRLGDLEVKRWPSPCRRVPFDLEVNVWENATTSDKLDGSMFYAAELFDAATIERLASHFLTLVRSIAANPDQPIGKLAILSESERRSLLADWDAPATEAREFRSAIELFEHQAAQAPDAIAVVFGRSEITYRQLNASADRLASALWRQGVKHGDLVGVCTSRTVDMVASVLAIWKVGAAYVPLDPEHPADRIASILADACPRLIVTEPALRERLPADVPTLEARAVTDAQPTSDFRRPALESDPAYVIFTSGSTGKPKGVVLEHGALAGFLFAITEHFPLGATDRMLAITTISFDISILELFVPLCRGAAVVLATREQALDPGQLWELVVSRGVTAMQATPGHWSLLVDHHRARPLERLRILCGGEPMPCELARRLYALAPGRVWNVYGPTEATIWATIHRVGPSDLNDESRGAVTIGRPLAGYRCAILDPHGEPAPLGVAGELCLGGIGLARGYWRRPKLSAERFVPDPHGASPGARLYRTGDLCRRRTDGQIEFLGRIDQQVKLRGFRIELGEIEAALVECAGIRQSVVVSHEYQPGETRLVAYLVSDSLDTEAIRAQLARKLPDFMVPSAFMRLDSLPLSASGKVNRSALPAPVFSSDRQAPHVAPRDQIEESMAEIWRDLLGVEQIGIDDEFFRLGGHSLLAVRLMARVRDVFGFSPPLRKLLEAPTVRSLADAVRRRDDVAVPVVVRLSSGALTPPFFCFDGGLGIDRMLLAHGLHLAALSRRIGDGYPFHAVMPAAVPEDVEPARLIEFVAAQSLAEIRAIRPRGPYFVGGYCLGGLVALEVGRMLLDAGEDVPFLGLIDVDGPEPKRHQNSLRRHSALYSLSRLPVHLSKLRSLSIRAQARYVLERLPLKLTRTARPKSLRIDFAAYSYRDRLTSYPGRITLFRAIDAPTRKRYAPGDSTSGWGAIAQGGVDVRPVPGDHWSLLTEPNIDQLAATIRMSIREASPLVWPLETPADAADHTIRAVDRRRQTQRS